MTLDELHDENRAAYAADVNTSGYQQRIAVSNAEYIPALEAEVNRLRGIVGEPKLGGPPPKTYLCWCDGTACDHTTLEPFTVCDECKQLGHKPLPSDGMNPEACEVDRTSSRV